MKKRAKTGKKVSAGDSLILGCRRHESGVCSEKAAAAASVETASSCERSDAEGSAAAAAESWAAATAAEARGKTAVVE